MENEKNVKSLCTKYLLLKIAEAGKNALWGTSRVTKLKNSYYKDMRVYGAKVNKTMFIFVWLAGISSLKFEFQTLKILMENEKTLKVYV